MITNIENIQTNLKQFPTEKLRALKRLFWSDLNYDRIDDPLPMREWAEGTRERLAEDPTLLASGGQGDGFHIIYCHLDAENLRVSDERSVIQQLIRDGHSYGLFVFSNRTQDRWHFVNWKYSQEDGQAQRVARRISVGPRDELRTASERIAMLDLAQLSPSLSGLSPLVIQNRHDEAFDVEAVTKVFFQDYRDIFERAENQILGFESEDDDEDAVQKYKEQRRLFTQGLFNRLLFLRFLERKNWLTFNGQADYLCALWEAHKAERENDAQQNFYRDRLQHLFFSGLNNAANVDFVGIGDGFLQTRIGNVPYLNGGLFEENELDQVEGVIVPDSVIEEALDKLLYHYNFTVTESTPLDVEVAVDPEMLGKIFEELITGRHESGSYYTPKPVVAFMCREGLKGYLQTECPQEDLEAVAAFVDDRNADNINNHEAVLQALRQIRACDPACGSGAYLLGLLHELTDLRETLAELGVGTANSYEQKLEIIQRNLYGVDIDEFAVNIARLRLWLSLIVDFDGNVPPALPNLDYKIEIGDSLTSPDPSGGLQPGIYWGQVQELLAIKEEYLIAHDARKQVLKEQIDELSGTIKTWVHPRGKPEGFDWVVDFAEVFIQQTPGKTTLGGAMPKIVNQAGGQMEFTPQQGSPSGFDLVLTNPPFVRQELIKDKKPAIRKIYGKLYSGTADLYVFFYFRALQLLREQGMLVFISSNKWLRANYGTKLRSHMIKNTHIIGITDFGELPVFQTVSTFPMIIVAKKGDLDGDTTFTPVRTLDHPYPDVQALKDRLGYKLPKEALQGTEWLLTDETKLKNIQLMKRVGIKLGDYVDSSVYFGIKTGYNKAFVIDEQMYSKFINENPESVEILKPLAVGNDIRRWRIERKGKWLIVTKIGSDMGRYPVIMNYLDTFRPNLEKRQDQGENWWELRPCNYYQEFDSPKIIYPDIAKEPRFTFDTAGIFVTNTAYFIPKNDLFLLSILNSYSMWEFAKATLSVLGDPNKGGRLRFFRQFVMELPIPNVTQFDKVALSDLAQQCLDIRGKGSNIEELETEIDERVALLYGISKEDINEMKAVQRAKQEQRKTQKALSRLLGDK